MSINNDYYVHIKCDQLSQKYKNNRIHIALELADENKDWESFKILYKLSPTLLKNHLDITKDILDYNYLYLSEKEQNSLFI